MNIPWKKRVWLLYAFFITATIAALVYPSLVFFGLGAASSSSHHLVIEKLESEGLPPTAEECSGAVLSLATFIIVFLFCLLIGWIVACGWLLSRATEKRHRGEQDSSSEDHAIFPNQER